MQQLVETSILIDGNNCPPPCDDSCEDESNDFGSSYSVTLDSEEDVPFYDVLISKVPMPKPKLRGNSSEHHDDDDYDIHSDDKDNGDHNKESGDHRSSEEVGRELYWNWHFQEALAMNDSIEKFRRLSRIANDFQLAAKTYAQIIGTFKNNSMRCIIAVPLPYTEAR